MEVAVSELQATEGINDKLYCFGSAIQRALFEHQSRSKNKGRRRKPIISGIPDSVRQQFKGNNEIQNSAPQQTRRKEQVRKWNVIGKKIRLPDAMVILPRVLEEAAISITSVVYFAITKKEDILNYKSKEQSDEENWADKFIDCIMKEDYIIPLQTWLKDKIEEDYLNKVITTSPPPSSSSFSSSSSTFTVPTKQISFQNIVDAKAAAENKAIQTTCQLIRSTINLRMKQVLKADPDMRCNKEQTFRATIAVLGGCDGYGKTDLIKDEKKKKTKTKKKKQQTKSSAKKKKPAITKKKTTTTTTKKRKASAKATAGGTGNKHKKQKLK